MAKSIRARFLWVFLLLAVLLGGLLWFALGRAEEIRRQSLVSRTTQVASTAAAAVGNFLLGEIRTERDWSRALASDPWTTDDRQGFLAHTIQVHPEFSQVLYIGEEELVAGDHDPGAAARLRGNAAVKSVLAGDDWAVGVLGDPSAPTALILAVELHSASGPPNGVVAGVLPIRSLAAVVPDSQWENMRTFILDDSHQVVYRTDAPDNINLPGLGAEPGAAAALSGRATSGVPLANEASKGRFIASFAPIAGVNWAAAGVDDLHLAMEPQSRQERLDWELYAAVVVGGLLFLRWHTALVLQSIRRLQRAAQAVAAGDIGYRVRFSTGTDLDVLGAAFNDMAERLQEHQDLLHERNQQLNVLLRVVAGLRPDRDPEDLLRRITQDAAFLTQAGVGFLAQVEDDVLRLHEYWDGIRWSNLDLQWQRGEGMPGWVWLNHDTRSSDDYATDLYANEPMAEALHLHNAVCAPIVLPIGTVAGVLFVGNKAEVAEFTEDDIRIMELLARHAGVALEVEAAFQRERRIGATLQKAMLPDVDPRLGGLSIAREYQAASDETELGGDFYDVIPLSTDKIGLVIADVSGKGLRAAVQTAAVKYALRAYALEDPDPSRVLQRLNDYCCAGPIARGFVTLFYGVIDLRRWELHFANAGHQPPLLRRANGSVETLTCDGVVLGVAESAVVNFPLQVKPLSPGDTLVLYTDGISEARRGDDFLDTEGLETLLQQMDVDAHDTARLLLEQAKAFSDGGLRDDVALLVVKIPNPLPAPQKLSTVTSPFEL